MSPPIDWSNFWVPAGAHRTDEPEAEAPKIPATALSLTEKLKAIRAARPVPPPSAPLDASTFKARLRELDGFLDEALARKPIDWSLIGAAPAFGQPPPPIDTKSESPIEEQMRQALVKVLPSTASIEQQKPLCGGAYRADFAVTTPEGAKVVVECDGHEFHEKTREQAARDKKRDRELQIAGWKVLRFTGSEIYRGAEYCARDVARALKIL